MGENEPNPVADPSEGAAPPPAASAPGEAQATEAPPAADPPPPAEDPEIVALRATADTARRDAEQAQGRLRAVSKAYTDLQAEMKSFRERMEARAKLDSELQAYEQVRRFFDPVMNLKRSIANPGNAATPPEYWNTPRR